MVRDVPAQLEVLLGYRTVLSSLLEIVHVRAKAFDFRAEIPKGSADLLASALTEGPDSLQQLHPKSLRDLDMDVKALQVCRTPHAPVRARSLPCPLTRLRVQDATSVQSVAHFLRAQRRVELLRLALILRMAYDATFDDDKPAAAAAPSLRMHKPAPERPRLVPPLGDRLRAALRPIIEPSAPRGAAPRDGAWLRARPAARATVTYASEFTATQLPMLCVDVSSLRRIARCAIGFAAARQ